MDLTIFFPCYNDGGTIGDLVKSAAAVARGLVKEFEIIVVNDGSPDNAQEVLDGLKSSVPELRIVRHERNRGYGAALRSGFESSRGDLVFYTDGDAQYDPRELKALFDALTPEVEVVNGWKIARKDPWHRVVIGEIYRWIVKAAFGLRLRDPQCDFRLMRRKVLDKISLQSDSGVICIELVRKLQDCGARFFEAPVHHFERRHGGSQCFRLGRVCGAGVALPKLWWSLIVRGAV